MYCHSQTAIPQLRGACRPILNLNYRGIPRFLNGNLQVTVLFNRNIIVIIRLVIHSNYDNSSMGQCSVCLLLETKARCSSASRLEHLQLIRFHGYRFTILRILPTYGYFISKVTRTRAMGKDRPGGTGCWFDFPSS